MQATGPSLSQQEEEEEVVAHPRQGPSLTAGAIQEEEQAEVQEVQEVQEEMEDHQDIQEVQRSNIHNMHLNLSTPFGQLTTTCHLSRP